MFQNLLHNTNPGGQRRPAGQSTGLGVIENVSRRNFLVGSGSFVIGITLAGCESAADAEPDTSALVDVKGGDATPSLWISIEPDNTVKITCHRSEMGQQVWTSMAQIVTDELDADWDNIEIVQAVGHPRYGDQNTDGSRSVRFNFHRLRVAGAAMRRMLEQAAAEQWGVDLGSCRAEMGHVIQTATGDKLTYGELAASAASLSVPAESDIALKTRDEWRYIGKPVASLTVPKITRGQGTYGIDVDRPGMVYAVVARPPQVFGTLGQFDDAKARAVPGVLQTVELPSPTAPPLFKPLGGVAVVATDTWAAIQGRKALEIEWQDGPNAGYNTEDFKAAMAETARQPGTVQLDRGDATAALGTASKTITAEYYVPNLAHSPMEPPCATAEWDGDTLVCWAAVQDPQSTRNVLAGAFEISEENVTVHPTWLGGAFGRKSKPDFVVEAAMIAREVGKPVKITWTREDDLRYDYFHSESAQRFEAVLDDDGKCTTLLHRSVFPPIPSTFAAGANEPASFEMGLGATDNPFNVENLRVESGKAEAHIRIGWLRSVCNIQHAFGVQSFAAELAHAAGRDPKDYLLELIGPPRHVDPKQDGASDYGNYSGTMEEFPIDTARLANVTNVAADMAGWGRDLPDGHGLGIATHRSFLSYIATVVEVGISPDGSIAIPHVWLAIDAGTVVNPKHVTAQMEGGTLYGLSNALYGEITATNGAVEQDNFPRWRVMRMSEAPRAFDVRIIESNAPPAGVGEPATPPAAPALANAIFAATGQRIRTLPILGPSRNTLDLNG